jgi:hypothetical protein
MAKKETKSKKKVVKKPAEDKKPVEITIATKTQNIRLYPKYNPLRK